MTTALRWTALVALVVAGYWHSFGRAFSDLTAGSGSYLITALLMVVLMVAGMRLQHRPVLPIHDREVDWIIGLIAMVFALCLSGLLVPRLAEWTYLLQFDLLSMVVFVFGAVTLLFGARTALIRGPVWLVLLFISPPVYLVITLLVGGGATGTAVASVIAVTVAVVATATQRWRGRLAAGGVSLVVGLLLTVAVVLPIAERGLLLPDTLPEEVPLGTVFIPPLVGGVAALLAVNRVRRRGAGKAEKTSGKPAPVVPSRAAATALVPLVVAVVLLELVPQPVVEEELVSPAPPSDTIVADGSDGFVGSAGVLVPVGWSETDRSDYPWAARYFGAGTELTRQAMRADLVIDDWDRQGRRRDVMVDSMVTSGSYNTRLFGSEALYETVGGRRSAPREVDLGNGVTGTVYTVLDDEAMLTYTRLNVVWPIPGDPGDEQRYRRTTVVAVDDHSPEAHFPDLTDSLNGMVGRIVSVLLRGGALAEDSPTKADDADVVAAVGRGIVHEVWKDREHD